MATAESRANLRNLRREAAKRALDRGQEPAGRVERATAHIGAMPKPRPDAPGISAPKQAYEGVPAGVSDTFTNDAARHQTNYERAPFVPEAEKAAASKAKRKPPVRTAAPVNEPEPEEPGEPTTIGGGQIPGYGKTHDWATNPRSRGKPPNYKIHVLTALSLALLIRIGRYGGKALSG